MMRRVNLRKLGLTLVIMTVGCAAALAQGDVRPNNSTADEQAIRDKVKEMETGWNTKSASLFTNPFAANADYVVINGVHVTGRDEIEKSHQRIFDTVFKDSTLSLSTKQIRLLRPDVALVHVSGQLKNKTGPELETTDTTISLVMTKEKDEWRIVAFQNTAVHKSRGCAPMLSLSSRISSRQSIRIRSTNLH